MSEIKRLLYRPDQVAEMLSMHVNSVYELVSRGELQAHNDSPGRPGLRILASSIEAYILRYSICQPTEKGDPPSK